MTQHLGSIKNFFIYNTDKSINKPGVAKPHFVLNVKKRCFYFSKQNNNESMNLKKTNTGFLKTTLFLLHALLIDFTILTIQKIIIKVCVFCKHIIKKAQIVSKNKGAFIKKSIYVFLPQHKLKEQ